MVRESAMYRCRSTYGKLKGTVSIGKTIYYTHHACLKVARPQRAGARQCLCDVKCGSQRPHARRCVRAVKYGSPVASRTGP
eukprot:1254160-Pleurochrysis_carterae.AAC.3